MLVWRRVLHKFPKESQKDLSPLHFLPGLVSVHIPFLCADGTRLCLAETVRDPRSRLNVSRETLHFLRFHKILCRKWNRKRYIAVYSVFLTYAFREFPRFFERKRPKMRSRFPFVLRNRPFHAIFVLRRHVIASGTYILRSFYKYLCRLSMCTGCYTGFCFGSFEKYMYRLLHGRSFQAPLEAVGF